MPGHTFSLFRSALVHVAEFRGAAATPELTEERGNETASLTIIRRGTHLHHARGRVVVADPGSAILYRGMEGYRLSHPFTRTDVDISLFIEFEQDLLDELFGSEPQVRDHGQPLSAETLFAAAVARTALAEAPADRLSADERAIEVLGRAAADLTLAPENSVSAEMAARKVMIVRDRLANTPEDDRGLAELASEAGCSPSHLSRLFRRATGLTLRAFRLRLRLAAVLDGLAEGEANLTDLALRSGFVDHAHMSNSFRRAFGMTPSLVRARLGGAGLVAARKRIQAQSLSRR